MGQVVGFPSAFNDRDVIVEYIESWWVFSWPPALSSGKASANTHASAIHMEKLS